MGLKHYIPRGSEVSWKGPSDFARARLYGFLVAANAHSVHDLLTRYIKRPSQKLGLDIDIRGTTLDRVLFLFLDSERRQRPAMSKSTSGGRQAEQLFAIVVLGRRVAPAPQGFVLFAPYVYASDTPGWRAEREIYGYPQQHGRVSIDEGNDGGPRSLSVESLVIKDFAENATTERRTFLRIEKTGRWASAAAAERHFRVDSLGEHITNATTVKHVNALADDAAPVVRRSGRRVTAADASFFERGPLSPRRQSESANERRCDSTPFDLVEALSKLQPMLFLKQFRDIVQPTRACYQAIVEAQLTVKGKVDAVYLDQYTLTLENPDSVPIRRELGIPSDPVPVEFAFRLDLEEMTIEKAHVISNPYWNPAVEVSLADETSRLPPYVDRGGEAVWRHPSLLVGARIYGFGVQVKEQQQREMLDACINQVAAASSAYYGHNKANKFQLSVLPGLDTVMLMFVDYKRIMSGNDDDRLLGSTCYREFLIMHLAPSLDQDPPELNWFIPFIYLDTDSPRLAGREIFGYPKQFGTIGPFERYQDGGGELDAAKMLQLSAVVVRHPSQQEASQLPVVRVDGPEKGPPTILKHYLRADEMIRDQLKHLHQDPAKHLLRHLGRRRQAGPEVGIENALVFSNVGNVFLKQFRDCADPSLACYQAVCKTDTVPGQFHGGGALDPRGYTITIQRLSSEPLLRYIGQSHQSVVEDKIKPDFAYWADLDVELTNGRVIANAYEAGYVPDVSAARTSRTGAQVDSAPARAVRRSSQAELLALDLRSSEEY